MAMDIITSYESMTEIMNIFLWPLYFRLPNGFIKVFYYYYCSFYYYLRYNFREFIDYVMFFDSKTTTLFLLSATLMIINIEMKWRSKCYQLIGNFPILSLITFYSHRRIINERIHQQQQNILVIIYNVIYSLN